MLSTPCSLWSQMCGEASCRSRERLMPRNGDRMLSTVLDRGLTPTACRRSSLKPSASLETGDGAVPRVRTRLPCRLHMAGRRSPRHCSLRRPARPPWNGDRA